METNSQQFRVLLLKLQDRLTDDDRRRLHFFFGDDVPRRIRDDPSLGGTLSLMESLFDQDKINEQDFTFLIRAFDEIKCCDAANLLREHMRKIKQSESDGTLPSLTSIMPVSIDHKTNDETDKFNAFPGCLNLIVNDIQQEVGIKSKSTNLLSEQTNICLNWSRLKKVQQIIIKSSPYMTVFLIIILSIILGFFIEQNRHIQELNQSIRIKDVLINTFEMDKNESTWAIKELENRLKETIQDSNNSLIRPGKKYGGTGGSAFDDSMLKNFSCSFYLRGMVIAKNGLAMEWVKFLYSSNEQPDIIVESDSIGQQNPGTAEERFVLNLDERVSKVQFKLQTIELIVGGIQKPVKTIRGVRLFTTKGRASRFIEDGDGEIVVEQFDGYTAGYVRGRRGLVIDQIQLLWYRTIFN